jgi:threonine dehydratase
MKTQPASDVWLSEIAAARLRLNGAVVRTPCVESAALSELTGAHIFCKQEHLQRTGSFKERGARNALAQLRPERTRAGVIAASAGNRALGLAWHRVVLLLTGGNTDPLAHSRVIERGLAADGRL